MGYVCGPVCTRDESEQITFETPSITIIQSLRSYHIVLTPVAKAAASTVAMNIDIRGNAQTNKWITT